MGLIHHKPETYGVTVDALRKRFAFYAHRFPQFTRPAGHRPEQAPR